MNDTPARIRKFGSAARGLWSLAEDATFLNHGSFGACPLAVQADQERIRKEFSLQPELFYRKLVMPDSSETGVRRVASEIGAFVGAPDDNIALIENATTGIQAVLQSVPLNAGDEILITDHQYRAVRLAVETRCRETGAVPRIAEIPLPADAGDITARISEATSSRVRLAIIDHITSATAIVFPLKDIVTALHTRGIPVLVDGAHAIGQLPLDLGDLDVDWYVSNAHKWLFAPPGTAFLYAHPRRERETRCLITSHFADRGFPSAFDYVGTRDYVNWLTIPAAIAFFRSLEPDAFRAHNEGLIRLASARLMALGALPVCATAMCANMRSFILPQRRPTEDRDGSALRDKLWHDRRIQVAAGVLSGRLLLRISAQAYVDADDVVALGQALGDGGWPGLGG